MNKTNGKHEEQKVESKRELNELDKEKMIEEDQWRDFWTKKKQYEESLKYIDKR